MKLTKKDWIKLSLLPFKTFVVIAIPLYYLIRAFYPHPMWTYVGNNKSIIDPLCEDFTKVFILCGLVLVLGAVIQFVMTDTKAGVVTCFFAVVPVMVLALFLFLWFVAHLL